MSKLISKKSLEKLREWIKQLFSSQLASSEETITRQV
jgi:hypothetical protein